MPSFRRRGAGLLARVIAAHPGSPLTWFEGGPGDTRNLHGTPSRYKYVMAVKPQASGLQGCEGARSVKPSAKPTLVRTQHLWVPKTYATWADALGIAVGSVKRLGVGRAGLGSAGGGMIFGLWA